MKKIKLVEDAPFERITTHELITAIKDPKTIVVAKDNDGTLHLIAFKDGYTLIDERGQGAGVYGYLSQLVSDYDVFIIGDPAKL